MKNPAGDGGGDCVSFAQRPVVNVGSIAGNSHLLLRLSRDDIICGL
jgi:hypothetical protein